MGLTWDGGFMDEQGPEAAATLARMTDRREIVFKGEGGHGGRTRGRMHSRSLALRVRPANIELRRAAHGNDDELPVRWLLCEWLSGAEQPTKYWLSNLAADTSLRELVKLVKLRWRIEHDYRELKDALGLDHF